MNANIRVSLRGSAIVGICVSVYVRHHDDGTGACAVCAIPLKSCVARRNSAKVITAAGLVPAKFDGIDLFGQSAYIRPAFGWGGQ